jgi:hypothetical protein
MDYNSLRNLYPQLPVVGGTIKFQGHTYKVVGSGGSDTMPTVHVSGDKYFGNVQIPVSRLVDCNFK